jgi:hypothetical protein
MRAIVVDCDKVMSSNLTKLIRKIGKPQKPKENSCSALIIEAKALPNLSRKPVGDSRVKYLNSEEFVKSIVGWEYFSYNKELNTASILRLPRLNPELIIEALEEGLPEGVIIQIRIPVTRSVRRDSDPYLKLGFGNPYICEGDHSQSLCLTRDGTDNLNKDIDYVLSQAGKGPCTMSLRFTSTALKDLKKISVAPSSRKGKDQREMGGLLSVKRMGDIFEISVMKGSIYEGTEDGIEMYRGVFNFHTHPRDAYTRHNVTIGWPSPTDYTGFLIAWETLGTILHVVVSQEGLYVMSLSPEWDGKVTDSLLDLADEQCCWDRNGTVEDYLQKVNSVEYGGNKIFEVVHFPWGMTAHSFQISYPRSGQSCLFTDEIADKYELLGR